MIYTLIVHICSNTNSTWTGKNIYVDDLKSLHRLTYIYVLYILYVVYIIYSIHKHSEGYSITWRERDDWRKCDDVNGDNKV